MLDPVSLTVHANEGLFVAVISDARNKRFVSPDLIRQAEAGSFFDSSSLKFSLPNLQLFSASNFRWRYFGNG